MNNIVMNILEYRFNEQGSTTQIIVALQGYSGVENINSRIILTQDYVQSINENLDLDKLNREQCEVFARRKLRDWIMDVPSEVPPVDDEPIEDPEKDEPVEDPEETED